MTFYPAGAQDLTDDTIEWTTADIRCLLVNASYTFARTDGFLSDIAAGERVTGGDSGNIAGTFTLSDYVDGTEFNVPETIISGVPSGQVVNAVVWYLNTGSDATARLLIHEDTRADGSTPITFTADGNNIRIPAGVVGQARA